MPIAYCLCTSFCLLQVEGYGIAYGLLPMAYCLCTSFCLCELQEALEHVQAEPEPEPQPEPVAAGGAGSLQAFLGAWYVDLRADLIELGAETAEDLLELQPEHVDALAGKLRVIQASKFRKALVGLREAAAGGAAGSPVAAGGGVAAVAAPAGAAATPEGVASPPA